MERMITIVVQEVCEVLMCVVFGDVLILTLRGRGRGTTGEIDTDKENRCCTED